MGIGDEMIINRMQTVLYILAEVIGHLGILMQPVVPAAAAALLDQLAVPAEERSFRALWRRGLPPGREVSARRAGFFHGYVESDAAG